MQFLFNFRLFQELKDEVKVNVGSFTKVVQSKHIRYVRISQCPDAALVQVSLTVGEDLIPNVRVHNIQVSFDNDFWCNLPRKVTCVEDLCRIIARLDEYKVCSGNYEEHFQTLGSIGVPLVDSVKGEEFHGYREGDFGMEVEGKRYNSTYRSIKCELLHRIDGRCSKCKRHRSSLNSILWRKKNAGKKPTETKTDADILSCRKPVSCMTVEEMRLKLKVLQKERKKLISHNESLLYRNMKLQRKVNDKIRSEGIGITEADGMDIRDILTQNKDSDQFSDYEKLFMEQQLKYNKVRSKSGMRWHPTIVKWAIYLRSKSTKAYKTLRDSGFIHLPSERTLYDYTHYVKGYKC